VLRSGKAVVLAAYLRAFHPDAPRPEGALGAFRLTFAASGGSQLIAGEGEGLLAEAAYPRHGRLTELELAIVRRYSDFAVRNVDLLLGGGTVDHAWTDVGPTNEVIVLEHPRFDHVRRRRAARLPVDDRPTAGFAHGAASDQLACRRSVERVPRRA